MKTRIDIRKLLADPQHRREHFVKVIQTIQAREGIVTTREQAERAYDAVHALHGDSRRRKFDGRNYVLLFTKAELTMVEFAVGELLTGGWGNKDGKPDKKADREEAALVRAQKKLRAALKP